MFDAYVAKPSKADTMVEHDHPDVDAGTGNGLSQNGRGGWLGWEVRGMLKGTWSYRP